MSVFSAPLFPLLVRSILTGLFLGSLIWSWQQPCLAATASAIKKDIAKEQDRAKARKKALTALSARERRVFKDLAKIEDNVQELESTLARQRKALTTLTKRQETMQARCQDSLNKRAMLRREAQTLVRTLWPVFITRQMNRGRDLGTSWAKAEREATWLTALYEETGTKLLALKDMEQKTQEDLQRLEQAKAARLNKVATLQKMQEDLLGKRLTFLHEVKKIRSQELDLKEQLKTIAETIKALHYNLEILDTRSFPKLKGHLPWPAKGRVVKGFRSKAKPPHRGVSLALPQNHPVRAVSWGKVVYDDQLRGFGRVIILFHGKDYYSLYAFLAQSEVHVGQKVEKGEIMGKCGYYPRIKGHGLYFELRFRQKPINPSQWLEPA